VEMTESEGENKMETAFIKNVDLNYLE